MINRQTLKNWYHNHMARSVNCWMKSAYKFWVLRTNSCISRKRRGGWEFMWQRYNRGVWMQSMQLMWNGNNTTTTTTSIFWAKTVAFAKPSARKCSISNVTGFWNTLTINIIICVMASMTWHAQWTPFNWRTTITVNSLHVNNSNTKLDAILTPPTTQFEL